MPVSSVKAFFTETHPIVVSTYFILPHVGTCIIIYLQGQVPPYAMPQITQFSVQESIIKTVEAAVEAYGLKSLAGSDGEVSVKEDVKEIASKYNIKSGDSIQFTATLNAAYDESKKSDDAKEEDAKVADEVASSE